MISTTLIHKFFSVADRYPDLTAIAINSASISYIELADKVDRVANHLIGRNIQAEDIVVVCGRRSINLIATILGVMKSGAACLPVSPDTPENRLAYIVQDSGAVEWLTVDDDLPPGWLPSLRQTAITNDVLAEMTQGENPIACGPINLSYILYTSGTSGRPKGVMIEHRSLANRVEWMRGYYNVGPRDVVLQKTPVTFDVSMWEIFLPLVSGAKMVLLPPGTEHFPPAIIHEIQRHGVTLCHFIPSLLNAFLNFLSNDDQIRSLKTLRCIFASGEALTPHHVLTFNKKVGRSNGTKLINFYGPTEATIDVTYHQCTDDSIRLEKTVPIGKAIASTSLYVVDQNMHLLGSGATGELLIGGIGVARGYVNNPALTNEKFFHFNGERVYRSGDLVAWNDNNDIEIFGRIDDQIKIRGMRIELSEIEQRILSTQLAEDCIVNLYHHSENVDYLIACCIPRVNWNEEELRRKLKLELPAYMLPAKIILFESFPRLSSGKVDRKGLLTAARLDGRLE